MKSLRKLGLSKYETSIYKTLIQSGTSTVKGISENSGVPITAVYPNLNSLIGKQLVQKINSDPSLFSPLPTQQAINNLIRKKQDSLNGLKTQVLDEINGLSRNAPQKNEEIIKLTRGKEFSSEIYADFISRTKKTFYIMGWRFEKIGDRYNILKNYKSLLKKGVDIRIIVTGMHQKNPDLISAYKEAGINLRFFPADNFSIVIIDGKECKITLKNKDLPEKYNLQINDASLSQALQSYFLDTWEKSQAI